MEHVRIFPRLKDGGRDGLCWSASVEHLFSCVRGQAQGRFQYEYNPTTYIPKFTARNLAPARGTTVRTSICNLCQQIDHFKTKQLN